MNSVVGVNLLKIKYSFYILIATYASFIALPSFLPEDKNRSAPSALNSRGRKGVKMGASAVESLQAEATEVEALLSDECVATPKTRRGRDGREAAAKKPGRPKKTD